LVLDYVYMKMKKDIERKLLVVDEAWSLLSRAEEASYIFEIVKTCRKFNMGLFLINQEVEGMLNSEAGRSALANSSYTILLRQKPAVIEGVQKVFHLSNVERIALLTAGVGEGILLMEDEHSELKIVASGEEHKQITTNADELLEAEDEEEKEGKKINIKVDSSQRIHLAKNLSKEEREYLIKKRFKEENYKSIFSNKNEKYLIKPRFNETAPHCFLTYDISNYLKQKKNITNVQTPETKKPDITFFIGKKEYGIEVETGKLLKTNKKALLEKIERNNKEYGNRWFFVVTNRKVAFDYSKLAPTTDKRSIKGKIDNLVKKARKLSPKKKG